MKDLAKLYADVPVGVWMFLMVCTLGLLLIVVTCSQPTDSEVVLDHPWSAADVSCPCEDCDCYLGGELIEPPSQEDE